MDLFEPTIINYLNMDDLVTEFNYKSEHDHFMIYLDQRVTIQRRTVYGVFQMFGDLGGLNDFLILIAAPVFSFFSGQFKESSLV